MSAAPPRLPFVQAVFHPTDFSVRVAEERRVDNIFVATDGRGILAEVLTGSHTEQVLQRAPCAVTAVAQV